MLRGVAGASLAVVLACRPGFEVPGEATIACRSDSGCPHDMQCARRLGRCAPLESGPEPRIVSATATSRTSVVVVFNQPIAAELADDAAHYSIASLEVLSAA